MKDRIDINELEFETPVGQDGKIEFKSTDGKEYTIKNSNSDVFNKQSLTIKGNKKATLKVKKRAPKGNYMVQLFDSSKVDKEVPGPTMIIKVE